MEGLDAGVCGVDEEGGQLLGPGGEEGVVEVLGEAGLAPFRARHQLGQGERGAGL
ncbi:hypothetical protein [Streptomyces sp. NPDC014734]|uniref:hypothetical protein n=1 Tax=Streptomyces sp. NPDC014734 TaxID=3364886 RepID=UPI0036FD945F